MECLIADFEEQLPVIEKAIAPIPTMALPSHDDGRTHHRTQDRHRRQFGRALSRKGLVAALFPRALVAAYAALKHAIYISATMLSQSVAHERACYHRLEQCRPRTCR